MREKGVKDLSCAWLTVAEAADFIKVDVSTIHRYIKNGRLKAGRSGGKHGIVRICLEDLNTMLEEGTSGN